MQLLLITPDGRTRCVDRAHLPTNAVTGDLKALLSELEGLSVSLQRLSLNGKAVCDETPLHCVDADVTYRVTLCVAGGKGGFGSLLRNTSARVGQKKTSNFGACRDLNGRRIRHVEDEKALADWALEEHKRDAKREQAEYRAIKKGLKPKDSKPCKFGVDCKYKFKCQYMHPGEEEQGLIYMGGRKDNVGRVAGGANDKPGAPVNHFPAVDESEQMSVDREDVMSSVQAGLNRLRQNKRKAAPPVPAFDSTPADSTAQQGDHLDLVSTAVNGKAEAELEVKSSDDIPASAAAAGAQHTAKRARVEPSRYYFGSLIF